MEQALEGHACRRSCCSHRESHWQPGWGHSWESRLQLQAPRRAQSLPRPGRRPPAHLRGEGGAAQEGGAMPDHAPKPRPQPRAAPQLPAGLGSSDLVPPGPRPHILSISTNLSLGEACFCGSTQLNISNFFKELPRE